MKNFWISILAILLSLRVFIANAEKHALIIAVGEYTEESGWMPVSAEKDALLISYTLQKQGFDKKNILILLNKKATKEGIKKSFEKLQSNCQPNDIAFIHFSGHGQQIFDNSKDELDGFDESLIPIDAHKKYSSIYKGEKHLRDDELFQMLLQIRKKVGKGGEVVFTIDACNSGTAARSGKSFRGTKDKFVGGEKDLSPSKTRLNESFFYEFYKDRKRAENLAPLIVISASGSDQLNYEYTDKKGNTYGSLSYSLAKVLMHANSNLSYRAFFEQVKQEMSFIVPQQSPEVEGDIDKLIFGGRFIDQQPYFSVAKVLSDQMVIINGGEVMGLTKGSQMKIFPPNTKNKFAKNLWSTGIIQDMTALTAKVKLNNPVSVKELKRAWVFTDKIALHQLNLKVFLDLKSFQNNFFQEQLAKTLHVSIEEIEGLADIAIKEENNTIKLSSHENEMFYSKTLPAKQEDLIEAIATQIQQYRRAKLIRDLQMFDHSIHIDLELIPVIVKKVNEKWMVAKEHEPTERFKNGNYYFSCNECFKIKLKNKGSKKAYYQILDIAPNNKISVLYPSSASGRTPSECIIDPGEEIKLNDIFIIGELKGKEVLKIIASHEALQLNTIMTSKGMNSRGDLNELETIFAQSLLMERNMLLKKSPGSANISTKIISVQ